MSPNCGEYLTWSAGIPLSKPKISQIYRIHNHTNYSSKIQFPSTPSSCKLFLPFRHPKHFFNSYHFYSKRRHFWSSLNISEPHMWGSLLTSTKKHIKISNLDNSRPALQFHNESSSWTLETHTATWQQYCEITIPINIHTVQFKIDERRFGIFVGKVRVSIVDRIIVTSIFIIFA